MKSQFRKLCWLGFLLVFGVGGSLAADDGYGHIEGEVVDAVSGKSLSMANIIIQKTTLGAASDEKGQFLIDHLPAGTYVLQARLLGYEPTMQKFTITSGQDLYLKIDMKESFFQGDQVVVTATRTRKLMENVPVVTELITQNEIAESGAENLAQVLEDRPGITIEEGVAGGKTLRMSGIDGKYILVLIDGTPIAGKFNNRMELNLIDADKIDHIEIVKGPSSALYGSDAMGGVINIITKSYEEQFKMSAQGKAGSYQLFSGNLNLGGEKGNFGYMLNADHSRGGIDKNEISINVTDAQSTAIEGLIRAGESQNGNVQLGVGYKEDIQDGEDPVFYNRTKIRHWDGHLDWQRPLDSKMSLKTKAYLSNYLRTYSQTVRHSGYLAGVDSTWENIIGLKSDFSRVFSQRMRVDFGLDYSFDHYQSARVETDKTSRSQYGFFAQAETYPTHFFTLIFGGRYDKISAIDPYFSPRISGMVEVTPSLKLRVSWGGGFRAPSFTDMYIDYNNVAVGYRVKGNPDLKPESSRGHSVGLEYFLNYSVLINATLYQNKFRDMILDYSVRPNELSYRNIESATFTGVEVQSRFYVLRNLTTTLSYNYAHARQSEQVDQVSNISPHTVALRVNCGLLKNRLNFSLRDQFFGNKRVREYDRRLGEYLTEFKIKKPYHLMDASAVVKLHPLLSLRVGATNLSDYVDELYGPWIGRRFFLSLEAVY